MKIEKIKIEIVLNIFFMQATIEKKLRNIFMHRMFVVHN